MAPDIELADEVFAAILGALPFGISYTDILGHIRYWNDTAEQITGYSAAEAMSAREAGAILRFVTEAGEPVDSDAGSQRVLLRHREGYPTLVERIQIPLHRSDSSPLGMLDVFSLAEDRVADAAAVTVEASATLLVEIDDYDQIVKRFGVEAAEKVTQVIDKTLSVCLQPGDAVFSESGWRLRVFLNSSRAREGAAVASRLHALLQNASFPWWGSEVRFSASIGGATRRMGESDDSVYQRAEQSLQQASGEGRGRIVWAND